MTDLQLDWLIARLKGFGDRPAIVGGAGAVSYRGLAEGVADWGRRLHTMALGTGECVAVVGDTSPGLVALVVALSLRGNTIVPFAPADPPPGIRQARMEIAQVTVAFEATGPGEWAVHHSVRPSVPVPAPLAELRAAGAAGLVLFSSGSTGEVKAALHSLPRLVRRFRDRSRGFTSIQFMAIDHIGGVNTLFHTLCNGGTAVTEPRRTPERICRAVERHRVQLLPTTPTFLNMLLMSGVYRNFDLSSLELVTYGTEPMREVTLRHLGEVFPSVRFKQTYGLTETGILPTRSSSSDSLLMSVGGHGFETRIVDGVLWIRSPSSMLGYLNSADPFDDDGWLNTGDAVEVAGDGALRVVGRRSKVINVGGEKVYPTEIENVLLQAENVRDVVVEGRANAVTGQVVAAYVDLLEPEDRWRLSRRLRAFCTERLAPYKVPAVFTSAAGPLHGNRFKRLGDLGGTGAATAQAPGAPATADVAAPR